MNLNSVEGTSSVEWMQGAFASQAQQPLTWFKVRKRHHNLFETKQLKSSSKFSILFSPSLLVYFVFIFKAYFDAPGGQEPLALDMGSMGKGQIWINGQSIGRHWTIYANGDCRGCSYAGTYRSPKCQTGCGEPTQRW